MGGRSFDIAMRNGWRFLADLPATASLLRHPTKRRQDFDLNTVASEADRLVAASESSGMNRTFIPEQRLRLAMRSSPACVTYHLSCSKITSPAKTDSGR